MIRLRLAQDAWADPEYRDFVVSHVKREKGSYAILRDDGWTFSLVDKMNPDGIIPKKGDSIRLWPGKIGTPIRGVAINSNLIFWQSADEIKRNPWYGQ